MCQGSRVPARGSREALDDQRQGAGGVPVPPARTRVARGRGRWYRRAGRRMRLQLALILLATSSAAHADGSVSARGVYYKERATRGMQPMLDGLFEVGARGLANAHILVDSITRA